MKKEEDIFKIFNDIDELFETVKFDNNIQSRQKEELNNVPEIQKLDDNLSSNESTFEVQSLIAEEPLSEEIINKEQLNDDEEQKKSKKKKSKEKKKSKKWVIIFLILDLIAIACLFLVYGPISYFRNLWVTSAMTTRSHQYLAYIFFNKGQIDEILANNTVIEVEGNTNKDEIIFEEEKEEIIEYSSPEEEQVLTKDEGNELYKVIKIEGNNYKGHMLVVYDPSKIDLVRSPSNKYGLTIEQFVERNGAVAGTNAGGFIYYDSTGYLPLGTTIDDGIIISEGDTGWGGGVVGFTQDNILVLTKSTAEEALAMGIRDAVSFGPFLIVNGVASEFKGNGGYGIAPRTAIGQRKDGIVLMLVIDGRRPGHSLGIDMAELTNIMLKYGAYNASNLDGGGSSAIVVNGNNLSIAGGYGYTGDRYLSNAWILRP